MLVRLCKCSPTVALAKSVICDDITLSGFAEGFSEVFILKSSDPLLLMIISTKGDVKYVLMFLSGSSFSMHSDTKFIHFSIHETGEFIITL